MTNKILVNDLSVLPIYSFYLGLINSISITLKYCEATYHLYLLYNLNKFYIWQIWKLKCQWKEKLNALVQQDWKENYYFLISAIVSD